MGEEVTFSAFIKNEGDTDILLMGYTRPSTSPTPAKRSAVSPKTPADELIWENALAMCDDAAECDFDSTVDPLAAGAFLGGGKHTLQNTGGGGDITWTPTQGEYMS